MDALLDDLAAEHTALDDVLGGGVDLSQPTPATGWTVADSIGHLWYFDERATVALRDPEAFRASVPDLIATLAAGGPEPGLAEARALDATELIEAWRAGRAQLLDVARATDPSTRVPWYGPDMGLRSFITARLMETWAHGQDVVDAVGARRDATHRLRHIAHIGVGARAYSYLVNGRELPVDPIAVVLDAPGGEQWAWSADGDGTNRVEGDALDFCLVVTQRRHLADTALRVTGPVATEWMSIAQAFAGPAGPGRAPLSATDR